MVILYSVTEKVITAVDYVIICYSTLLHTVIYINDFNILKMYYILLCSDQSWD